MNLQKIPISEELEALKKEINKVNSTLQDSEIDGVLINDAPETEIEDIAEQKESLLVTYTLTKKSRSKKMLFNYELIGRNGKDGFLQILGGEKVTSGCVIIPADKEEALLDFFNRHEIDYSKKRILTFPEEN